MTDFSLYPGGYRAWINRDPSTAAAAASPSPTTTPHILNPQPNLNHAAATKPPRPTGLPTHPYQEPHAPQTHPIWQNDQENAQAMHQANMKRKLHESLMEDEVDHYGERKVMRFGEAVVFGGAGDAMQL
ncbi:hypothetical protein HDU98_001531 [Podochytrium sp. JEL0797]|nr:hypothetical protein HDU98_001531 [Podochytrium sp. JEL0797]